MIDYEIVKSNNQLITSALQKLHCYFIYPLFKSVTVSSARESLSRWPQNKKINQSVKYKGFMEKWKDDIIKHTKKHKKTGAEIVTDGNTR